MKLKSRPDDFQVEELTTVTPSATGVFSFYRLTKRGIGTPEAISVFCKALRIDPRRVRYGGLKDRHAETKQYLTIDDGPERKFKSDAILLEYLGKVQEPFGPQSISGNRFSITMRDLEQQHLDQTLFALAEIKDSLIANYFDDQRFGSVGRDQQYVARALIDGDDEEALRRALTTYYEHDRFAEKKTKATLRQHWGEWKKVKGLLPRGYVQEVVHHLALQPEDYRGAFARIPFFLRNMYLSAYQSHLWNQVLAHWHTQHLPLEQLVTIQQKYQRLPMPGKLTAEQITEYAKLEIPLPSARVTVESNDPFFQSFQAVLEREQLKMNQIKLKNFREPFFSKGSRAAFFSPENLQYEAGWDKLNKGHRKLRLSFELPRGCYATMVVKRITITR